MYSMTDNSLFYTTEHTCNMNILFASNQFVTEGVYDIARGIETLISKVITNLKSFMKNIYIDITALVQRKQLKSKLKKLREKLLEEKDKGVRKVEIFDYEKYASTYQVIVKNNSKKFSRIVNGKYKYKADIEKALYDFERQLEKDEETLDYIYNYEKVTKDIDEVLSYVERNINGKIGIEKALVDTINEMERLKTESARVLSNIRISDDKDIRSTYTSSVRKAITRFTHTITSSFKKWIVRIICFFA